MFLDWEEGEIMRYYIIGLIGVLLGIMLGSMLRANAVSYDTAKQNVYRQMINASDNSNYDLNDPNNFWDSRDAYNYLENNNPYFEDNQPQYEEPIKGDDYEYNY